MTRTGVVMWLGLCLCAGCTERASTSPSSSDAGPRSPDAGPVVAGPPGAHEVRADVVPEARVDPSRTPLLDGKAVRFTLSLNHGHRGLSSLSATLGGRPAATARFSADGRRWVVLGNVPIATDDKSAVLRLDGTFVDESPFVLEKSFDIARAAYDKRTIHVPKKYVRAPRKARLRAAQEKKDLARVLEAPHPERLWRGSFVRPTATKETSPYGTLRTYNRRRRPSRHLGWDLDGATGDPIRAAQSGRVALVQDRYYSGGTVVLDHGQGLFTMYFHMSAFDVKAGDTVTKGELIGRVGKSGRVTGPHLHFSVKLGGVYADPADMLALDLSDDPDDVAPLSLPPGMRSKLTPAPASDAGVQ